LYILISSLIPDAPNSKELTLSIILFSVLACTFLPILSKISTPLPKRVAKVITFLYPANFF